MSGRSIVCAAGVLIAVALAPAPGAAHVSLPATPPAPAPGCPSEVDPARFTDSQALTAWNDAMDRLGNRPTASPSHQRWVDFLARRLRKLPGAKLRTIPYSIDRWLERKASLAAGAPGQRLGGIPVSGSVPYSKRTKKAGVTAPLAYVPKGQALTGDLRGKVVVRDAAPGSVPNAAFAALQWFTWDPEQSLTLTIAGNYERDYLGYLPRIDDIEKAADAGAAGIVFVHGFPRDQVRDHYAPYEGKHWRLPALYVGADEGERLKQLAGAGGSARIRLLADRGPARTETLVATLPGMSEERIVVESHTDGMNAIWDNGPVGMLALARHFAALPRECRPRTIELVFTTAHLYQQLKPPHREGAADDYAKELDRAYDEGTVALVMAMEHMGAREYTTKPRPGGAPGRVLEPTGLSEPTGIFIGESPALVEQVATAVIKHDLRRTLGLRGADLPGLHLPPHHSFGGEGTPFHKHLIPTVALVTGPWTLYNPAFGMEAVDIDLLRRQTLTFTDLIHSVGSMPREAIAGGMLGQRGVRDALCASSPDGYGVVPCQGAGP